MEIQTKGYCVNLPVFICTNLLTLHADSGQLYVTIEPSSAALKLRVTSLRVGPGHPSFPLSIYFPIFPLFTFPFLSFTLRTFFFCPSLPFLPE